MFEQSLADFLHSLFAQRSRKIDVPDFRSDSWTDRFHR
jgi:hypothetical protein